VSASFFSRLRRAEGGRQRNISGQYLIADARDLVRREDKRRKTNRNPFWVISAASLAHPASRQLKNYWRRR
jgi:hypothetical protein